MESVRLLKRIASLGVAIGLVGLLSAPAVAQKVDFSGKRVEAIVPFGPGGGADVYMRAIAPYLEQYLPGHPTVIIRNVPGGGSIPGANEFEVKAKPDGLHAFVISASTVANFVFKKSKIKFHLDKWQPVILSPQGVVIYVASGLGVTKPQDLPKLKDKQLVFGGDGPTSGELRIIVSLHLLGLKAKDVWGLRRGPTRLAFERGEFNINYDTTPAYKKKVSKLIAAGKAVPVFGLGVMNEQGKVVRDPNFAELPSFPEAYEMMHGKKPSGHDYDAWKALFQMGVMANKGVFLPTGTPKPIVDAWVKAMHSVFADPKFQKSTEDIVGSYSQFFGDAARPILKEATTLSPEVWDWIRNYLKTEQNVTL
jgi:hypothetical protein